MKQLINGVEGEGWRFVAFVRLVPLFPFNLLNYALGLTRIPLLPYVVATLLFMLPGALAYTYLGYAGREAVAGGEGLIQKGLLALALLAAVAFLPRLIGKLRRGAMLEFERFQATARCRQGPAGARCAPRRRLHRRTGAHRRCAQPAAGGAAEAHGGTGRLPGKARGDRLSHRPEVGQGRVAVDGDGFADVHVVRGGMTKWNEAGLPVIR